MVYKYNYEHIHRNNLEQITGLNLAITQIGLNTCSVVSLNTLYKLHVEKLEEHQWLVTVSPNPKV